LAAITKSFFSQETHMNIRNLSAALMVAASLVAAPAFAQNGQATKQKTQEGGNSDTPCNLVANPTADPDCRNYKQHTQSMVPPVNEDAMAAKKQ
jgi:hypothetical protein